LGEKIPLLGGVQLVPEGQNVALTVLLEQFSRILSGHNGDSSRKTAILSGFEKFSRKFKKIDEIYLTEK
jgi:hypothetical protein